jgi:hypothetical protein
MLAAIMAVVSLRRGLVGSMGGILQRSQRLELEIDPDL